MSRHSPLPASSLSCRSAAQRQPLVPLWVYLFSIGGPIAAVFLATVVVGIAPDRVLKDPAAYFGTAAHVGFFSNVGILAWWTATAACLTAAAVLHGWGSTAWKPLAAGGILTAVLCVDDLLLLHEEVFPTHLGVPEAVTFAVYGSAAALYLWRFRQFHRAMETSLLLIAVVLFAISVVIDLSNIEDPWWGVLLEDGAKFSGIVAWATYHARSACSALQAARPSLQVS